MSIIHISAECYPVAKVGGLADVVGALPKYQKKLGIDSKVIMPFYDNEFTKNNSFKTIYDSSVTLGKKHFDFKILTLSKKSLGFDLFLVDIPDLLFKNYVYSSDDTDRFLAFQIATLDWILQLDAKISIIHCHDHHTGLIPFMLSHCFKYKTLKEIPSILTIHNAQYQGWFSHDHVFKIPQFDFFKTGLLDWNQTINPLAAAIKCAWRVTTVSPSYMEELKVNANGLESLLSHETAKCTGILNGIDTKVWNSETDSLIIKNYSQKTIQSGKKANKKELCERFNLDKSKPLFSFIGRLVYEKGADLFPDIFYKSLLKKEVNILILGSGDKEVEAKLKTLNIPFKNYYNSFIGYDEKLAHQIYAGADFLLMPSRVEPCGLNQMYALRYGTIPIVRNIGGLKDTVIDIKDDGFGICHNETTVKEVCEAINRATILYQNQQKFKKIRKLIMQIDHSWDSSAQAYINLYNSLNQ